MEEIGKDLAKELLTMLKSTKEFVIEQAPDVVQQLIAYSTVESSICLFVSLVIVVVGASLIRSGLKSLKKDKYDDFAMICVVAGSISGVVGLTAITINSMALAKVLVAPKIFLIEYLSRLV